LPHLKNISTPKTAGFMDIVQSQVGERKIKLVVLERNSKREKEKERSMVSLAALAYPEALRLASC
ncbi:MAG: hypothetical protein K0R98_543, partial [Rickettsiaceae bacterium]|nr:hypothetical protein [Rickettsiaceae bacterium]